MLPGFSCTDLVAVLIKYNEEGVERRLVYVLHIFPMIPRILLLLRNWGISCATVKRKTSILLWGAHTMHITVYGGSTNCNSRGETLLEFLNTTNLEILNRGNEPTFCSGRSGVIDITLGSLKILESIIGWEVSYEPSLSDHRHILFTLRGSVPVHLIRNPTGTNWGSFKEYLRDRLVRGPEMDLKSEAGLELAIHWVQQAPFLAYENNCPLRPVKIGRQFLKWTTELESLRRGVRRLFNACRSNKNPNSWDVYREGQRKYTNDVRKASRNAWRVFCSSIEDLPRSAKLHRALSKDPKIKMVSLMDPTGRRTQSEEETIELLHATHFPNSGITQEVAAPAAALLTRRPDCRLATRVVTYRRVEWAIYSFAPYKSPGVDVVSALLQQAREVIIPYLVRIFRACLATGYVPAIWRQVKVVFIPKPGRNTYSGPRDYRPVSLT